SLSRGVVGSRACPSAMRARRSSSSRQVWRASRSPGRSSVLRSIADGEAALWGTRQLHFVEKGDGRVLGGYVTAALGVHDGLVAADPETAAAFARGNLHGRTEVG